MRLDVRLTAVGTAVLVATGNAHAHVRYVTEESGAFRPIVEFVTSVLTDPVNATLLVAGGISVVAFTFIYLRALPSFPDIQIARETLANYADLVPWLLRLSLGLPLVGAGFAGYFFSPAVPAQSRIFQVVIGFLLLFGLATRAVAIVALVAYLFVLASTPNLLLASEYVGGLLGIAILGSGRPSADQILQHVASADGTVYGEIDPIHRPAEWFNTWFEPYEAYAPTAVRLSLGANFIYLGLAEKILNPGRAVLVVNKYELTRIVPVSAEMWVFGAGAAEVALGTLLILGLFTRGAAAIAFVLFTTTLFGIPDDPVLAHISLFGLASVLLITGSGPFALDSFFHEGRP